MRIRDMIWLGAGMVLIPWFCLLAAAFVRGQRVSDCPSCHSLRIRPSWPRMIDRLLRLSLIAPFRCEACQKRFYVRAKVAQQWVNHL